MDSTINASTPSVSPRREELERVAHRLIEQRTGRQFTVLRDFDWLANEIQQTTHTYISPTTLRRFWGYQERASLRTASLNIIANFIGYAKWADFAKAIAEGNTPQSGNIERRRLLASDLSKGTHVELRWAPNRLVVVRYEGKQTFSIVSVEGSKLLPGGIFHCMMMLENEPLYLSSLTYPDAPPTDYICGQSTGVLFRLVEP